MSKNRVYFLLLILLIIANISVFIYGSKDFAFYVVCGLLFSSGYFSYKNNKIISNYNSICQEYVDLINAIIKNKII